MWLWCEFWKDKIVSSIFQLDQIAFLIVVQTEGLKDLPFLFVNLFLFKSFLVTCVKRGHNSQEAPGKAKITNFRSQVLLNKDVSRFEVSMKHRASVQIVDPTSLANVPEKHLVADPLNVLDVFFAGFHKLLDQVLPADLRDDE